MPGVKPGSMTDGGHRPDLDADTSVLGHPDPGAARLPAAVTLADGFTRHVAERINKYGRQHGLAPHRRSLLEPEVSTMGLAATARCVTFFACG